MSISEYARSRGINRTTVQAAKQRGRVVLFPDGSIDPEATDRALDARVTLWARAAALKRWRRDQAASDGQADARQQETEAPPPTTIERLPTPSLDPRLPTAIADTLRALLREAGQLDYHAAQTVHAIVRAYSAQLEAARAKGELVDRRAAERVITAIARAERDAWLGWPARVSALIAAEVGCDPGRLEAALGREVRAQLEALASPELDLSAIVERAAE